MELILRDMRGILFCVMFLQVEATIDKSTLEVSRAIAIFEMNRERNLSERRQFMKLNSRKEFFLKKILFFILIVQV